MKKVEAKKRKICRVMLAVPSGGDWKADMAMSMMQLVAMGSVVPQGYDDLEISIHNCKGSILPQQRQRLVNHALEKDATHILFLDSDMTFPSWTLHKLLETGKRIVGANCATKHFPSNSTARLNDGTFSGGLCLTTPAKVKDNFVEQVWRLGTGILLIEMSVFKELKAPHFMTYYNHAVGEFVGEDWAFCELAEKANIPIFVDHVVSSQVGHIGNYTYSQSDVLQAHVDSKCNQFQIENATNH